MNGKNRARAAPQRFMSRTSPCRRNPARLLKRRSLHFWTCLLYTSILHLYACRIDSYGEKHLDEFLEVEKIPLAQAVEMAEKNEIFDAKTQVLILRAVRLVERGEL